MCVCVSANPDVCLSRRHGMSMAYVSLIGGCNCRCHFTDKGAILPTKVWLHNRQRQINKRVVVLVQDVQHKGEEV